MGSTRPTRAIRVLVADSNAIENGWAGSNDAPSLSASAGMSYAAFGIFPGTQYFSFGLPAS